MSNIVIKTEHLSKYYRLGVINNGVLFRDLQTWWALKRGKQDPHSRIGENKYDSSKEGFWALKDLNFEIQQGDRVGIIGKNGAGKSTLLKILSRITAPSEGEIKIKGRVASLLEVGTGFHGELTGRENIYLNGAILGMKRREVYRKLDEIIAFSEIEQHIDTPVKRYSSGMYVRLAFAVAAHLDSEILIADEVLAVGDASFQKKALGKMNELSSGQGRTVLFVSHNMAAVQNLCNKGIVLEKGKINFNGKCADAITAYINNNSNTSEIDGWIDLENAHWKENCQKVFSRIRILNMKDEFCQAFTPLDSMKIEVELQSTEKLVDASFCIAMHNNFSQWITSYSTWMFPIEYTKTPSKIVLDIPKLRIAPGNYHLYLSCTHHTAGVYIDKIENAINFEVVSCDIFNSGREFTSEDGMIVPDGNFMLIAKD